MKEVISVHVGQAGNQIGSAVWELYGVEHDINCEGYCKNLDEQTDNSFETFYYRSNTDRFVPRALLLDLEPSVVDEVRTGAYKDIFHPSAMITGNEDAANNFARGYFSVGKLVSENVADALRTQVETADGLQGFAIYRSLGGGTGSGFTAAVIDCLEEYSKKLRMEIPIYPAPQFASSVVEPYNCLLGEHFSMDDLDFALLIDNEALYEMVNRCLLIQNPNYHHINRVIALVCSNITACTRFDNVLKVDLNVMQTNLVPYPRIHFPLISLAPLAGHEIAAHEKPNMDNLIRNCFKKTAQMVKVENDKGCYMSCVLCFRGDITPSLIYKSLGTVKRSRENKFVDWCPTGFKVGICTEVPVVSSESKIAPSEVSCTMLTNNTAIGDCWSRITNKFHILYSKRSFVHWFVGEGMEETELTEALFNFKSLIQDYEEAALETSNLPQEEAEPAAAEGNQAEEAEIE